MPVAITPVTSNTVAKPRKPRQTVPKALVYEVMDGHRLYYKGYKDVLNHQKTIEEIMGCSHIQTLIIEILLRFLYSNLPKKQYSILTGEAGLHLSLRNNFSADIAIYPLDAVQQQPVANKYLTVPPKVIIEVDTKAELERLSAADYYHRKTQHLFNFGVTRVIWIYTASQKIFIATPNNDWLIRDWNKDVEIMDDLTFNIGAELLDLGYTLAMDTEEI